MPEINPAVTGPAASRRCAHFDGQSLLWISMALTGPSGSSGSLRYEGFRHFTVESWVYPQPTGQGPATLFTFTGSNGVGLSIGIENNRLTFIGTLQATTNYPVLTTYSEEAWYIPNDQWTHVAVAVSLRSAPQVSLYLNGALVGQITTPSELLFLVESVTIGAEANGSNAQDVTRMRSFFRGCLSDFRVWSSTRTAEQIAASFATGNSSTGPAPGQQDSLWAYWPMSSVSGQQMADLSGNGNNAQIIGSIMTDSPQQPRPSAPPQPAAPMPPSGGATGPAGATLPSTLSDIARGMQHVVNATQEVLEQHYVRMIDRFLNPDGSARIMPIQLNESFRLDVPLIALLNPPSLALDEMQVQMSVRVDDEFTKTFPPLPGTTGEMSRSCFTVTMAPPSGGVGPSGGRASNVIDITMKFKAGDRPEGVTRIIHELTARMLPVAVNDTVSKP